MDSVQTLNFDGSSFKTAVGLQRFVCYVLERCRSFGFRKVELICGDKITVNLAVRFLEFVNRRWIQELDTDVMGQLPRYYNNTTLIVEKTLGLKLSTLKLSSVVPENVEIFGDSNLQHLVLVDCVLKGGTDFGLNAPNLVALTVSGFKDCECMVVDAHYLKSFNWRGKYPIEIVLNHLTEFEEVNICICSGEFQLTKMWYWQLKRMLEKFCFANFINISLEVYEVVLFFLFIKKVFKFVR